MFLLIVGESILTNAACIHDFNDVKVETSKSSFFDEQKSFVYQSELSAMLRKNSQVPKKHDFLESKSSNNDNLKFFEITTISTEYEDSASINFKKIDMTSKNSFIESMKDNFMEISNANELQEIKDKSNLLKTYDQEYSEDGDFFYNNYVFFTKNMFDFQRLWESYPSIVMSLFFIFSFWIIVKVLIKITANKNY